MKYFTHCRTIEELDQEYRRLAKLNHPDKYPAGANAELDNWRRQAAQKMAEINEEHQQIKEWLERLPSTPAPSPAPATSSQPAWLQALSQAKDIVNAITPLVSAARPLVKEARRIWKESAPDDEDVARDAETE